MTWHPRPRPASLVLVGTPSKAGQQSLFLTPLEEEQPQAQLPFPVLGLEIVENSGPFFDGLHSLFTPEESAGHSHHGLHPIE